MPRQQGIHVENNFTRGLITEATGLNFPENACTDTDNCVFTQIGEVRRRLGIDFENNFITEAVDRNGSVVASFLWSNVAGEGSRVFVVVQVGSILYFYNTNENSLSNGLHATTIDITDFLAPNAPSPATVECQFTSGNGILFVTHPYLEAFRVSYDPDLDTLTDTQIDVEIRDFEGLDSGFAVDNRPTSTLAGLSAQHNYNLRNQGWTTTNLTAWDTAQTTMPSNADVSWYFKDADDAFDFSTAVINSVLIGNTPAAKGHFVLNLYDQDREVASGVSGATGFSTGFQRCATCTFFAGRLFYSGLSVEDYNSRIFFSQIIENPDQYGKCYQANDPTAENLFDLLPPDGGVIKILDAGRIIKLVPVFGQLIVFASNGIWAISGSEGLGFSAVDYTISKVSSTRVVSHSSFVDVDGMPVWWAADGIYTLEFQAAAATPTVKSLTDQTIKNFYDDISFDNKIQAKGVFNPVNRIVQWVYRSDFANTLVKKYNYDRILNLNTLTGAFYPWSIDTSDTTLNGVVVIEAFGGALTTFNVVSNLDDVQSDGDDVIVIKSENPSSSPLFKYIVSTPNGVTYDLTFAEEFDDSFLDFTVANGTGVNYDSYFLTGYKIRGDAQRKFQSNHVYVYNKNERDNQYKFQGRYDYATAGNTGRWTTNNVTVPTGDYEIVKRKLKVRGHGIACQYKISSVEGQPFDIVGWSAYDTINKLP